MLFIENAKSSNYELEREDVLGALTFANNYEQVKILIEAFKNYGLKFQKKIYILIAPFIEDYDECLELIEYLYKNFKRVEREYYIQGILLSNSFEQAEFIYYKAKEHGEPLGNVWLSRWGDKKLIESDKKELKQGFKSFRENFQKKYNLFFDNVSLLNLEELRKRSTDNSNFSKKYYIKSQIYSRNIYVKQFALKVAEGICQLCEFEAPFNDKYEVPFLEVHHIKWLSKGGTDSIDNVISLCPNCHRKMHVLDLKLDVEHLQNRAKELASLS